MPSLLGDLLGLAHHVGGQLARQRELADVHQRRVGQAADRVEGQVAPELEPDLGADVVQHRRLEAGAVKHCGDALHALAVAAVELAHRKAVALDVPTTPGATSSEAG